MIAVTLLLLLFPTLLPALEMTALLEPRQEQCFYVPVVEQGNLRVKYFVVSSSGLGGFGDMEVNFRMMGPRKQGDLRLPVLTLEQKEAGLHVLQVTKLGDYKVCFNNDGTFVNTKKIFFSIEIPGINRMPEDLFAVESDILFDEYEDEDIILELMRNLKNLLTYTQDLQKEMRAANSKDQSLADNSFARVNIISVFYLLLILSSGLLQTVLVRNLFEDPSRLSPVWRRLAEVFI